MNISLLTSKVAFKHKANNYRYKNELYLKASIILCKVYLCFNRANTYQITLTINDNGQHRQFYENSKFYVGLPQCVVQGLYLLILKQCSTSGCVLLIFIDTAFKRRIRIRLPNAQVILILYLDTVVQ